MENPTVEGRDPFVNLSEIRWSLEAVPPFERRDLLQLDDHELLEYSESLQLETQIVRRLLHQALEQITRHIAQAKRYRARLAALMVEVRALRRRR